MWMTSCCAPNSRETYQEVTGASVHVLVHEVQNGEPEGSEGGQGQQGGQVLEEDLEHQRDGMARGREQAELPAELGSKPMNIRKDLNPERTNYETISLQV